MLQMQKVKQGKNVKRFCDAGSIANVEICQKIAILTLNVVIFFANIE